MVLNQLCKEQSHLLSRYQALQTELKTLPEGDLLCVRNGPYIKWFKSNGVNPIYLPKKHHELAQKLAVKKYYTMQLNELSKEIRLLDDCIKNYQAICFNSSSLLDASSCYLELLKSYFEQFPNKLQQWITSDYQHNTNYPEHLIHKTISGHLVRSKSEVMIANALYRNKVPYRYECALHCDDIVMYPDFTICHPKTMEIFYWEHFGMMNVPSYYEKTYNKLKVYGNYGIIPSINLITTFETQDHPINSEKIEQNIAEYFLS